MVELSVVIPTCNRVRSLECVLTGLIRQDLPAERFEVVVVDDGSSDETRRYLASVQLPFCLTPILQDNQGPAVARNQGVAIAKGELVVFLDDDVVPAPRLLGEHLRSHQAHGMDVVTIGPMLPPPDFGLSPWVRWSQERLAEQYAAMKNGDWTPTARQFYTGNASLARSRFLEAGGFDARFRRAEDVELAYRLATQGLRFVFDPAAIGYHYEQRTFAAWLAIPYTYGRCDVVFAREKGQAWLLPTLFGEFRRRSWFVQLLTRLCLDRPRLLAWATTAFYWAVIVGHRLNCTLPIRAACSALFNLHHYQGIADGLGGRVRLLAALGSPQDAISRSGDSPDTALQYETN